LKQAASDPWLGPWACGCAGKRAFVETPYGPFWISGKKQLMTFGYFGPMAVSEEYERALLAKIGDTFLGLTEIAYISDPEKQIDRLEIIAFDKTGSPLFVVHDFRLREQTNQYWQPGEGQGYSRFYPSAIMTTFVRLTEAMTDMKDANGRIRLWAGDSVGQFHQLEDTNSDSGATYSADAIGLFSMGLHDPRIPELNWFGDSNVVFSYSVYANAQLGDLNVQATEQLKPTENLNSAHIGDQGQFFIWRLQLDAHPLDGNFELTDPPQVPMNAYGVILGARFKTGADRPEGRK
jgi:hypothetical protein